MNGYEDIDKCTSMQRLVACNNHISDNLLVATTPASLLVLDVADLVMRLHEIVVRQNVCGKKKSAPPARHKSAYGPLKTEKNPLFSDPHFLLHQYTALIEYSIFALHFSCWFALHQPL